MGKTALRRWRRSLTAGKNGAQEMAPVAHRGQNGAQEMAPVAHRGQNGAQEMAPVAHRGQNGAQEMVPAAHPGRSAAHETAPTARASRNALTTGSTEDDPGSYRDALNSSLNKQWKEAMRQELQMGIQDKAESERYNQIQGTSCDQGI